MSTDNLLLWPTQTSGARVPYGVFTDREWYVREQATVFRGETWSFVALEAEIPTPGDYKSTFVGDTPVIVTRDNEGNINVLQNRCAHRGALVCRERRGNARRLECVYHQWNYDLRGRLRGVPFRAGINGNGGMPADFNLDAHGLQSLRVARLHGLVFASFSSTVAPLEDYLGPMVVGAIARLFNREIVVSGDQRQFIHGNWKLYAENTRDPYHASLLHLFHNTFGLYRSSQTGACKMDAGHRHTLLYAMAGTSSTEADKAAYQDSRSLNTAFKLADPSVLAGRKEFDDGITLVILSVFPNLVVQQIANTLAVRQIVPYSVDSFELVWTHFGYADDDDAMQEIRLKQTNLIGPAGYVAMEDGEAVEIVQRAITRGADAHSWIAMGGGRAEDAEHLVTESAIVGFWENYRRLMGIAVADS
ncbi:MAG: aromatic ring-hydroxylating dioxygenase subunit alpha [Gammaproteobacteria bacterium]|nr:aromatic ring-hydroxylating dioxygenase subunit alpha [Gammaproteobacteria bacterium]